MLDRAILARTRRSCSATREPDSRHACWSVNRASCRAPRQGASSSCAYQGRNHLGLPKNAQSGQPKLKRASPQSARNVAKLRQMDSAAARRSRAPRPNMIRPVALTTDASSSPCLPATVPGTMPRLSQPRAVTGDVLDSCDRRATRATEGSRGGAQAGRRPRCPSPFPSTVGLRLACAVLIVADRPTDSEGGLRTSARAAAGVPVGGVVRAEKSLAVGLVSGVGSAV